MNLDPAPSDSRGEPQLLYVNFNQDNTLEILLCHALVDLLHEIICTCVVIDKNNLPGIKIIYAMLFYCNQSVHFIVWYSISIVVLFQMHMCGDNCWIPAHFVGFSRYPLGSFV